MPKSSGYVSAEFLRKAAEITAELKRFSYQCMALGGGSRAIDLGCGPGMDTIPLARLVGATGQVVGVDIDEEMLAEADDNARAEGVSERVRHLCESVTQLSFADESFDASRAERLLQVLPPSVDPRAVVAQMVRVTRRGGRVVLADADWGSFSIDTGDADTERCLTQFFAGHLRPNGYAGRQLYALLAEAGLQEIQVTGFPIYSYNREFTVIDWMLKEAVERAVLPVARLDAWCDELLQRENEGRFFCSLNMLVVSATRV